MTPDGGNWGGKRTGAGRPPSSTVTLKVKLPRPVLAALAAEAARAGVTVEDYAARLLMQHRAAPLFGTMQPPNPRD
ncbi:hypothetical protein [uncultured Deinococcus sp.]|uniref:hypothetical protein n=1 Tax=uncultured Deinococcus sp. TaxID=158789 RepID=UPI0025D2360B|nr:hypothetical protein [uncultured Deinococcus sp.]